MYAYNIVGRMANKVFSNLNYGRWNTTAGV